MFAGCIFEDPGPAPAIPTLAQVLTSGNSAGNQDINMGTGRLVFETGAIDATIGADGPTLLIDSRQGQLKIRTPMTTAGAEVGVQVEDSTGLVVWRLISFLASDSVSAEWRIGTLGAFRVGPDPLNPGMYAGLYATEGDYTLNCDGADPTSYVNFYQGDRIAFGDAAGQDQEIEVVTTIIQLFESTGLVREMRWTPPAANGQPWVKIFGANASGEALAGEFRLTADITPAALAGGTTNNYAPASFGSSTCVRQAVAAGGSTLSGLAGGNDGMVVTFHNINTAVADTLTFTHEAAGSTAGNRFLLPGNASLVVPANGSVTFRYDSTSSRWRVIK